MARVLSVAARFSHAYQSGGSSSWAGVRERAVVFEGWRLPPDYGRFARLVERAGGALPSLLNRACSHSSKARRALAKGGSKAIQNCQQTPSLNSEGACLICGRQLWNCQHPVEGDGPWQSRTQRGFRKFVSSAWIVRPSKFLEGSWMRRRFGHVACAVRPAARPHSL